MVPFPRWTPPNRMRNCRRESVTLPRDPYGSIAKPTGYLPRIYITVHAIKQSWLAYRNADPFALSAGMSESFLQSCEPCRRNCHELSQSLLPDASLNLAFFTGRSSENVSPCLIQLPLVEHDLHDWWAWGALLSVSRVQASERDKVRDLRVVERRIRENKWINRVWESDVSICGKGKVAEMLVRGRELRQEHEWKRAKQEKKYWLIFTLFLVSLSWYFSNF